MKTKKEVKFEVGQWVRLTRRDSEAASYFKKGTIGVVVNTRSITDNIRVAANFPNGESFGNWIRKGFLEVIEAPKFAVVWSEYDSDPTMLFLSLAEAKKFVASLKKRKGNRKAVEVAIYKRG